MACFLLLERRGCFESLLYLLRDQLPHLSFPRLYGTCNLEDRVFFTRKHWFRTAIAPFGTQRCAEMYRLRGVFLAAIGADEVQIEASLREAIRIAKEHKSVSLEKRAEATYAEYGRQKASGSGGRGFRVPLW
jgi:hypothetical protein